MEKYQPQAKTKTIKAESKVTIKVKDNYFSITSLEEREVPDIEGINMDLEWEDLFNKVNKYTDNEIQKIVENIK